MFLKNTILLQLMTWTKKCFAKQQSQEAKQENNNKTASKWKQHEFQKGEVWGRDLERSKKNKKQERKKQRKKERLGKWAKNDR